MLCSFDTYFAGALGRGHTTPIIFAHDLGRVSAVSISIIGVGGLAKPVASDAIPPPNTVKDFASWAIPIESA